MRAQRLVRAKSKIDAVHGLRERKSNGEIVATSSDGTNFRTLTGEAFAIRTGETFAFADGSVGQKRSKAIFVKNADGDEVEAFWFEDAVRP